MLQPPSYRGSIELPSQDWLIEFRELTLQNQIGKGAFGIVYAGKWRGQKVAIKKLRLPEGEQLTATEIENFQKEAAVMKGLRPHKNCVLLLGVAINPLCIVTEFVENGSLCDYLQKEKNIPLKTKMNIVKGIVYGMKCFFFDFLTSSLGMV